MRIVTLPFALATNGWSLQKKDNPALCHEGTTRKALLSFTTDYELRDTLLALVMDERGTDTTWQQAGCLSKPRKRDLTGAADPVTAPVNSTRFWCQPTQSHIRMATTVKSTMPAAVQRCHAPEACGNGELACRLVFSQWQVFRGSDPNKARNIARNSNAIVDRPRKS